MGYRSNVRIIVSKKGYEELKKFNIEYLTEVGKEQPDKEGFAVNEWVNSVNLLNHLDVFTENEDFFAENEDFVYFGWNDIKWYGGSLGYPSVNAISDGLDSILQDGYSYRFGIIGEDDTDMEIQEHIGEKEEKLPNLEYERSFLDNDVKHILLGKSEPSELDDVILMVRDMYDTMYKSTEDYDEGYQTALEDVLENLESLKEGK